MENGQPGDSSISFKELWQPGSVVSLWDMKKYIAEDYFDMARLLVLEENNLKVEIREGKTHIDNQSQDAKRYKKSITIIKDHADDLNMKVVSSFCEDTIRSLFAKSEQLDLSELSRQIRVIADCVRNTLRNRQFFVLDEGDIDFFDNNQFSSESIKQFETCKQDMINAGKCFAFEFYPACVFHLMRIVDALIKRLSKHYKLKPTNPNWGGILKVLRAKRDGMKRISREKHSLWTDVCEQVSSIKDATRNPLSHSDEELPVDSLSRTDVKYTPDEARRAFENVKALAKTVCGLLPQKLVSKTRSIKSKSSR
ncbi:MAG: hypothetical protein IH914_05535 [candidate division Zixibacteria bacterium]|nr:hypothetical protein [candidate division Zixibacteria bacterium]